MAKEGNLPLGDAIQAKVAPPVEHRALKEIPPINNCMKDNTLHFQFTFF